MPVVMSQSNRGAVLESRVPLNRASGELHLQGAEHDWMDWMDGKASTLVPMLACRARPARLPATRSDPTWAWRLMGLST